jgi:hypothetical protein
VIAAAGAGVKIAVTSISVTNAHASVGTKVEIRDALFITAANAAVTARCVTTGADVDVFVSGYKIGN